MTEPTFSRSGGRPRGNGYTMVPHWLWTADLPPQARILIGWLHSHSDAFLAKVTMNMCRKTFNSSNISKWLDGLADIGLVEIQRAENGKSARIILLDDAWQSPDEPRQIWRGDRAEPGAPTAPDLARIEEQGEEQGEGSSLRSDEDVQTQVATRTQVTPEQETATTYWEWHKATRGSEPVVGFLGIRAIAKKLLKAGYATDDIVTAMQTARAMNQKAVQDEIERQARIAAGQRVGPAIPGHVVRAFIGARTWIVGHIEYGDRVATLTDADLMTIVAWFCETQRWGVGETMLRMAVALRAQPKDTTELRAGMWRANVDRFPGELADYPDAMERAYRNQYWRAQ